MTNSSSDIVSDKVLLRMTADPVKGGGKYRVGKEAPNNIFVGNVFSSSHFDRYDSQVKARQLTRFNHSVG